MAKPNPPEASRRWEREDPTAKMSFFDHLEELRRRIFYALGAIGLGVCLGLYYSNEAFEYLSRPMIQALQEAKLGDKLIYTSPLGPLQLLITVGLYLGVVIASPFVLYQIWLFVAPGLYRHERKAVVSFLMSSVLLFLAGSAFGYYIMMPMTLKFLISFKGPFTPFISINEYFDMVLVILLGLGVVFQLPILIFFLSLFGIVTPKFLWNNFRYAVLIIAVIAAVVTPTTDVLTMSIFMAPMMALYLLGIGVSYLVVRQKRQADERARAGEQGTGTFIAAAWLLATSVLLLGGALLLGCSAEPQKAASAASPAPAAKVEQAPAPNATGGFDGRRAYRHVEKLVGIGMRRPGSEGIRKAQQYIMGELKSYGCAVEQDDFQSSTPQGRVAMKNIVAKAGPDKGDVILLLTHYDTFPLQGFVGANDGGSSTAVLLELARLLCARRPKVAVWIAFLDGEEAFVEWSDTDGVYGSRQMAATLANSGELKRVKAVILADMVGYRNLHFLRETNSTPWLRDLVWSVAHRLGYEKEFADGLTAIEDDHLPFVRRGVPAVDIIQCCSEEYPYWHTIEDTLDKVSPRSLAITGHVILESVAELEKKLTTR